MEKFLILTLAAVTTVVSQESAEFPLSQAERWQLLFIVVAALLTSLSTESAKQADDQKINRLRFFGNVGLGVMAGIAAPLLIGIVTETVLGKHTGWEGAVGLSILGAYFGRDMLQWLFGLVKAVKRLRIALANEEDDDAKTPTSEPAPKGGEPHAESATDDASKNETP